MKNEHEFRRETEQEQVAETHLQPEAAALSPEELLRADQSSREPPASVAQRLNESIANEPRPDAPWWKRLFS